MTMTIPYKQEMNYLLLTERAHDFDRDVCGGIPYNALGAQITHPAYFFFIFF